MLISVSCPRCRSTYRVQDALRGKAMRCLEKTCKQVFLIDDSPRKEGPKQTGTVGDILPLLPLEEDKPKTTTHVGEVLELLQAEVAEPYLPLERINPDSAVPAPGWDEPPPVRRAPSPHKTAPRQGAGSESGPRVFEAGSWEAPPVRRPEVEEAEPERTEAIVAANQVEETRPVQAEPGQTKSSSAAELSDEGDTKSPSGSEADLELRPRTRWFKWVIVPFVIFAITALGMGGFIVWREWRNTEERLARDADELFDKGLFLNAEKAYQLVLEKHPGSENEAQYRFRRDLSSLRKVLGEPGDDLTDPLNHTEQFLKEREKDPLLPEHAAGLGEAVVKMLTGYAENAAKDPTQDESLKTLARAEVVLRQLKAVKLPKEAVQPAWGKVDESFEKLRTALAREKEKKAILERLRALAGRPTYGTIVTVENYLREIEPTYPELASSEEVRRLLEGMYEGHLKSIRYVAEAPGATSTASLREDQEPSLLFDPILHPVQPDVSGDDAVALALSRGVLYGLRKATGQVRWAMRVGIDTTTLPIRLPARAGVQESFLVLSSDTRTLTAVDLAGNPIWRHRFQSPVLGTPLVVDQRAYLASYSGQIYEIELSEGKLLGRFEIGQPLTRGGTLDPGTRQVYFAADDGCVYVLDVAERRCRQILYSRHPSGSLRGEPLLVSAVGEEIRGYLILNQAAGLDQIRLRVFDLPLTTRDGPERVLQPPATLEGWTWFSPYQDPEKILLASDAGRLGMFGIRQAHNRDNALFPLLRGGSLDLSGLLFPGPGERPRLRGRAEVVEVQDDELWVLASDRLQRLRLVWGLEQGPRLAPLWKEPIVVGSPLHRSQVLEDRRGKTRLVTVTQPQGRPCTWVSCIDDEQGKLLWRRQLGIVAQGEALPLSVPGEGLPVWLVLDQAGGLFTLDPTRYEVSRETQWLSTARTVLLAESLQENLEQPPLVLPASDGKTVHVLAFPGEGNELILRTVRPAGTERKLEVKESKLALTAPLAGKPALVGTQLVLPLADGALARVSMDNPTLLEGGPTWRAERVDPDARSYLTAVDGERFVNTDGARGLVVWEWAAGSNTWTALPPGRDDGPTLEMKDRITSMVLLPGKGPRLAVSDSARTLSLIEVKANGGLSITRSWVLDGPITAGPFLRETSEGMRLGCVVDRCKLVWIDPEAEQPLWMYATAGEDPLVGEPQLLGTRVILADQSGLYVALDGRSGKPKGEGYRLRGSIAPVAGPVPFLKDRLLAPLSDGTMMLLDERKLQ